MYLRENRHQAVERNRLLKPLTAKSKERRRKAIHQSMSAAATYKVKKINVEFEGIHIRTVNVTDRRTCNGIISQRIENKNVNQCAKSKKLINVLPCQGN